MRTDIERMEGRARFLLDRVSLSTIRLTARSPHLPVEPTSESFGSVISRALHDGVEIFIQVCGGIIRVVAALLPLIIVLGGFLSVLILVVKVVRRRRRKG